MSYEKSERHRKALGTMQRALNHLAIEKEQQTIANLRVSAAEDRAHKVLTLLITNTPTGAGEETGKTIPWTALRWSPEREVWGVQSGKPIRDAVVELIQLARIANKEVTLADVNGAPMTAGPNDVFQAVLERWTAAGGQG